MPSPLKLARAATDTLKEVVFYYVCALLLFAVLFWMVEAYKLVDALYWAGITFTSTGYGDVTPKTDIGKFLSVIGSHVGLFVFAPLIVIRYIAHMHEDIHQFTDDEQKEVLAFVRQQNALRTEADVAKLRSMGLIE